MNKPPEPEIEKIKNLEQLKAHLDDWLRQCEMKILNTSVDAAMCIKGGNFTVAKNHVETLAFYDREKTICMHILSLIEVSPIQLATADDLANVKKGVVN
jgi:hypothetical protein